MKLNAFKIWCDALKDQDENVQVDIINSHSNSNTNDNSFIKDQETLKDIFKDICSWEYTPVYDSYISYITEELDIDFSNDIFPYDGYLYNMFETFIDEMYNTTEIPTNMKKIIDDWDEYMEDKEEDVWK